MIRSCHACRFDGGGALLERLLPVGRLPPNVVKAKSDILRYLSSKCQNCRIVDHDDISIKRSPHNVRHDLTRQIVASQPQPVTRLDEDSEDALRMMLATVTSLDPLCALLLFHVARGGTCSNFGGFLANVVRSSRSYGAKVSRMTARSWWLRICEAFRPFARLSQWAEGHAPGRRVGTVGRPRRTPWGRD